jgi:hypothetical protein
MGQQDEITRNAAASLAPPPLDAKTLALLAAFQPVVAAHVDDLVEGFLDYLTAFPEMASFALPPEGAGRFREAQGRHLLNIFSGNFDADYHRQIGRMHAAHQKIGLEPRWYLGAYGHILKSLVELAIEACDDDPRKLLGMVSAINRVVEIDMANAIAAFEPAAATTTSATPEPPLESGISGVARAVVSGSAPER